MQDFTELTVSNISENFVFSRGYDEKLEAECILRARTIFDEFVCPRTGVYMMCTFTELLNGVQRFWALAQEFKSYLPVIHEWIINLPLIFMCVLLRIIEREYTQEDHEKTSADPQLGEVLLTIFHDLHRKHIHFRRNRSQSIIFNTSILYARHLLIILGMEQKIKRIKWTELRVIRAKIFAPIRKNDFKVILESFRHFRDSILPHFSKDHSVKYRLKIENRIPEVMEPTRDLQLEWADFIFEASALSILFSLLLLFVVVVLDGGGRGETGDGRNFYK